MNDDTVNATCNTCVFKAFLSNSNLCKCYSSNYYNKKIPVKACEYYLADDDELVQLVLVDEKEE